MTDLLLHGKKVHTVFDLLGSKENDITFSLGWALANCHAFALNLMHDVFPGYDCGAITSVVLQDYRKDEGYTDIEIAAERAYIIVEAKRGWCVPGIAQLEKYSSRIHEKGAMGQTAFVVMSECAPHYAQTLLTADVQGIPVFHRSWQEVANLAHTSAKQASQAEKRVLSEVHTYLKGLTSMQDQSSNLVYVVSLNTRPMSETAKLSTVDFLEKHGIYFHPFGRNGWPKQPPNYLAFRYRGRLHSIHHVREYSVISDLSAVVPGLAPKGNDDHIVYTLDAPIRPAHEVKTGRLFRAQRVWAAIDLLLTCPTVSDARDKTKERQPNDVE